MVFVCLCVKKWTKFCSEYLKEQGQLGRTRHILEYNIKNGSLRSRVERYSGLDSVCSEQWLVWELHEQHNECRKFLD